MAWHPSGRPSPDVAPRRQTRVTACHASGNLDPSSSPHASPHLDDRWATPSMKPALLAALPSAEGGGLRSQRGYGMAACEERRWGQHGRSPRNSGFSDFRISGNLASHVSAPGQTTSNLAATMGDPSQACRVTVKAGCGSDSPRAPPPLPSGREMAFFVFMCY